MNPLPGADLTDHRKCPWKGILRFLLVPWLDIPQIDSLLILRGVASILNRPPRSTTKESAMILAAIGYPLEFRLKPDSQQMSNGIRVGFGEPPAGHQNSS